MPHGRVTGLVVAQPCHMGGSQDCYQQLVVTMSHGRVTGLVVVTMPHGRVTRLVAAQPCHMGGSRDCWWSPCHMGGSQDWWQHNHVTWEGHRTGGNTTMSHGRVTGLLPAVGGHLATWESHRTANSSWWPPCHMGGSQDC